MWWVVSWLECCHSINICHINHHIRMQISLGSAFRIQGILLWRRILGEIGPGKSSRASIWRRHNFRKFERGLWQFKVTEEKKPFKARKWKSSRKSTSWWRGQNIGLSAKEGNQPCLYHWWWWNTQGYWCTMWINDKEGFVDLCCWNSEDYR